MMNRASQNWPEDQTTEVLTDSQIECELYRSASKLLSETVLYDDLSETVGNYYKGAA